FLFRRPPRLRFWLAREPRGRDARRLERRRLSPSPSVRSAPDRPSLRLDHRADRYDARDRDQPAAAGGALSLPLAAGCQDVISRSPASLRRAARSILLVEASGSASRKKTTRGCW